MRDISAAMIALWANMQPRAQKTLVRQRDCASVLPDADIDFAPMFAEIVPKNLAEPEGKRADITYYKERLRYDYRGKPEILPFHMLLNAYLRRDTPWNAAAGALFFRLWNEKGEALLDILPMRDLVSALRSFGEHADHESDRLAARMAFIYATTLKAYESERKMEGKSLARADYELPFRAPKTGLGMRGLAFADDDGLAMVHFLLMKDIEQQGILGSMIATLVTRVFLGDSVFSRMDRARIAAKIDPQRASGWGFGFNPEQLWGELEDDKTRHR